MEARWGTSLINLVCGDLVLCDVTIMPLVHTVLAYIRDRVCTLQNWHCKDADGSAYLCNLGLICHQNLIDWCGHGMWHTFTIYRFPWFYHEINENAMNYTVKINNREISWHFPWYKLYELLNTAISATMHNHRVGRLYKQWWLDRRDTLQKRTHSNISLDHIWQEAWCVASVKVQQVNLRKGWVSMLKLLS